MLTVLGGLAEFERCIGYVAGGAAGVRSGPGQGSEGSHQTKDHRAKTPPASAGNRSLNLKTR
jgi:hypothetical protein